MNKVKGSEIISLRLSSDIVEFLRTEAARNRISLNAQLSMILKDHMELNSLGFEVGLLPFPKLILSSLIRDLDEKRVEDLAKQMAQGPFVALARLTPGANTLEGFIKTLEIWARHSAFPVNDLSESDTRTIIIKHDMGEKWSHFLSYSIRQYVDLLAQGKCDIDTPGEMLVIKIRNSPDQL